MDHIILRLGSITTSECIERLRDETVPKKEYLEERKGLELLQEWPEEETESPPVAVFRPIQLNPVEKESLLVDVIKPIQDKSLLAKNRLRSNCVLRKQQALARQ